MDPDPIKGAVRNPQVLAAKKHRYQSDFAKVLSDQQSGKSPQGKGDGTHLGQSPDLNHARDSGGKIPLGIISETMPTVSHFLVGHPQYGDHCWSIVHSERNRHKSYTKIQPGTAVFIDPEKLEISWTEEVQALQRPHSEAHKTLACQRDVLAEPGKAEVSVKSETIPERVFSGINPQEEKQPAVFLGTITENTPTVSHLLVGHPRYGSEAWRIIHSQTNRNKPYTGIQAGTAVYLDPQTQEIYWNQGRDGFSVQLVEAVQPYIGRPYEDMDCYELVVQGLVNLGVRYHGTGGLLERLEHMAAREGRPRNAYLNGEGLVDASGIKVYSKSFVRIKDAKAQAREVIRGLDVLLRKGFIVSFSTHTKGHTGIVSERNGEWTFINSGKMDHHLEMATDSRHVGEERLDEEITDWFALAAQRGESLKITVGRLDEKKLMTFRDDRSTGARQA